MFFVFIVTVVLEVEFTTKKNPMFCCWLFGLMKTFYINKKHIKLSTKHSLSQLYIVTVVLEVEFT